MDTRSSGSASRPGRPAPGAALARLVPAALPWLAAAFGPSVLLGPMLIRGQVMFWGTPLLQFLPWHSLALESLAGGHVPLWNPSLGMGAPLLANHQSALLYPPNLMLAWLGPLHGQGLLVYLHLIWAGLGMVFLARRLGLGEAGQAVAAAAFPLSGYVIARAGFLSMNAALAWIPWIILAALGVAATVTARASLPGQLRAAATLALLLSMQWLAGHAQTAWYTLILASVWLLWAGRRHTGPGGMVRAAGMAAAAAAFAAGLAAAQLLPSLEYWQVSQRAAGVDRELALTYSLWPWRLLGLLAPRFFGSPADGDYWGYGNFWEDALYIGVFPMILALAAIRRAIRTPDAPAASLIRLQVGLLAGGLLLALGKNTPLFPFLFDHIPTFSAFQAPARWALLAVFSLAILAALGADGWSKLEGKDVYWVRLGTAGSAAAMLLGLGASNLAGPFEPSIPRAVAVSGFWLSASGLALLARERFRPSHSLLALSVLVIVDLSTAGIGLNPSLPPRQLEGSHRLRSLGEGDHRLYMPEALESAIKFEQTHRFDTFFPSVDWAVVRESGLPNTPVLEGVASANNFDPIVPAWYASWIGQLEDLDSVQRDRWLSLMDVAWVAVAPPSGRAGADYDAITGAARVRVLATAWCAADPVAALSLVQSPDFDPDRVVVLEQCASAESQREGGPGGGRILHDDDPNSLTLEVQAPQGGWLLVSDTWYPGWTARVDGEPAMIYRADVTFRAVPLDSGARHVEFCYEPWTFRAGGLISLASWLALLSGLAWTRGRA